jgi:flavodoxin
MPKYLVVTYSLTGNSLKIGTLLAEILSADTEEIKEIKPRSGPLCFASSVAASILKMSPEISKSSKNLTDYDVVILGCPVWASNMATPMRAFIRRENPKMKQVGLFCTLGGGGGNSCLSQMAILSGRPPLANLMVDKTALDSGVWRSMTETFAHHIQSQFVKKYA